MNGDLLVVNGDIISDSVTGNVRLVYNNECIIQTARHNIIDSNINRIYDQRLKMTSSNLGLIASYCKDAILHDTRLIDVPSITAERVSSTVCNIIFTVKTLDGALIDGFTSIEIK